MVVQCRGRRFVCSRTESPLTKKALAVVCSVVVESSRSTQAFHTPHGALPYKSSNLLQVDLETSASPGPPQVCILHVLYHRPLDTFSQLLLDTASSMFQKIKTGQASTALTFAIQRRLVRCLTRQRQPL